MQRALAYVGSVREQRVSPPIEALAALDGLTSVLPDGPGDPYEVVAQLDEIGSPATMRSTGGRYFGFVNGGTEPVALAAAMLVAAWDQNTALPIMSPIASRLDTIAARWVLEALGLPSTATASFCSGASIANLTCILAARDALLARAGWDLDRDGMFGAPPINVVMSEEIHIAVRRAVRVAGIGAAQIRTIPTDECGRARADALGPLDDMTLVLLQAGNVNTGHCDPFAAIIPAVHTAGGWVHVDGAFGLWAGAAPTLAHHVVGVEHADSWATDAHKWLNATYDSAVAMCARGDDLRRAMSIAAAYVASDDDRPLMQLGLQMSQRARAVEVWAILAAKGRAGLAEMIEGPSRLAALLADRLTTAGVELLAPVALNQALVAFGDDETTDAVLAAVQAEGTAWAGGTSWKGRRAMRLSVSDTSTTIDDIERTAAAIIAAHRAVHH